MARIWTCRAGHWETVLKKVEEVRRGVKVEEAGESESIDSDEAVDTELEGMAEAGNGGVAEERGVDAMASSEKTAAVAEEEHEKNDDVDLVVAEMVVVCPGFN